VELRAAAGMERTGAFVPQMTLRDKDAAQIQANHPEAGKRFALLGGNTDFIRHYFERIAEAETLRRLTVAALALNRYQLAHHSYPSSLADLVPAYLPELPRDFMDGKPLRYKLNPDGTFLLYSVGEDGEDNGGDPTAKGAVYNWLQGRDIVWPRAATKQEVEEYQKAQHQKPAARVQSR